MYAWENEEGEASSRRATHGKHTRFRFSRSSNSRPTLRTSEAFSFVHTLDLKSIREREGYQEGQMPRVTRLLFVFLYFDGKAENLHTAISVYNAIYGGKAET